MMSKMKSRRITYAKIVLGVILAGSLTASFALEQKKSTSILPNPEGQTKTILVDGHEVQISGDKAGVEKLLNAIAKSEAYGLWKDPATGKLTLGEKIGNQILVDEEVVPKIQLSSGEEVFMVVDEMPVFLGGIQALRNFLAQSVKYPPEAVKKGIQGKVYVTFVVNKDGSVSNAKIARGVDPSLDTEALRVVKLLPKWKPGRQKGQEVAVQYTVPISFKLE